MDRKLGREQGTSVQLITFVKDRAGHDLRYASMLRNSNVNSAGNLHCNSKKDSKKQLMVSGKSGMARTT
jgi:dTDP-D-glucose 4,6-dehydratase